MKKLVKKSIPNSIVVVEETPISFVPNFYCNYNIDPRLKEKLFQQSIIKIKINDENISETCFILEYNNRRQFEPYISKCHKEYNKLIKKVKSKK